MFMILSESVARERVFDKYKNVMALSMDKGVKITDLVEGNGIAVQYAANTIRMSDDEVNAILNNQIKYKKVLKQYQKRLTKLKMDENMGFHLQLATILNGGINPAIKGDASRPRVVVFVYPDGMKEMAPEAKKVLSLQIRFITDILAHLDLRVMTDKDKKTIKKIFKGKNKKIAKALLKFKKKSGKNRMYFESPKALRYLMYNRSFYRLVHVHMFLTQLPLPLSKTNRTWAVAEFINTVLCSKPMPEIVEAMPKKKDYTPVLKKMRKQYDLAMDLFNEVGEICENMGVLEVKIPKMKAGVKKNLKTKKQKKRLIKFRNKLMNPSSMPVMLIALSAFNYIMTVDGDMESIYDVVSEPAAAKEFTKRLGTVINKENATSFMNAAKQMMAPGE